MNSNIQEVEVCFSPFPTESHTVGILALQKQRLFFEYDSSWIKRNLELSPFTLPLKSGLVEHRSPDFGPLFGLFDDSLPDGWGLLLMDRHFRSQGIDPISVSSLDRLLYIGRKGMGALTFHPPAVTINSDVQKIDLQELANQAKQVYEGNEADILPILFLAGGSPGGARPKVLIGYNEQQKTLISGEDDLPQSYDHWIIKFPAKEDGLDSGLVEYAYAKMAKLAGIKMPENKLFNSAHDEPFFGVKRFDRKKNNQRIHTHTFGNLIQSNFRIPACDYDDLFKVTGIITRNQVDLEEAFRLMVFNILSHNRDDHVKNFSFILNDEDKTWSLSPAYDLTYCNGPGGEHSTTVAGQGYNIHKDHCLELAKKHGISFKVTKSIFAEVEYAVKKWSFIAKEVGVSLMQSAVISEQISSVCRSFHK